MCNGKTAQGTIIHVSSDKKSEVVRKLLCFVMKKHVDNFRILFLKM